MHTDPELSPRFAFGKNWLRYISAVDEERIETAKQSIAIMLGTMDLTGKLFLDVGCGSGLFSLAAHRMGATVFSFDYDPQSVYCAMEIKKRFSRGDMPWDIVQGSILDRPFVEQLPRADIVFSWGVLHHTGDMWTGIGNCAELTRQNGAFCLAIYNDQKWRSRLWTKVKIIYNTGALGRWTTRLGHYVYAIPRNVLADRIRGRMPHTRYTDYKQNRGMSYTVDIEDWLGGLPFEVASPQEIFEFLTRRDFTLTHLYTVGGGHGNNRFTFRKD